MKPQQTGRYFERNGGRQRDEESFGRESSMRGRGRYEEQGYGREARDESEERVEQSRERFPEGEEGYRGQERQHEYGREPRYGRSEEGYGRFGREPTWRSEGRFYGRQPGYGREEGGFFEREPGSAGTERYGRFGRSAGEESAGSYGRFGQGQGRFEGTGWASEQRGFPEGQMSPRWSRGEHVGKGPKGYKRSDERIREDVCEALARAPDVDASEIDVNVREGEVTLTGTVDERRAKRIAEDLAEDVSGVSEVQNQIRVKREGSEPRTQGAEQTGARKGEPYRARSNG